ncbi:30S ribosomal protein S8 [bacterium]|nr:30S ribosomal protein S8 [bacterium]|tara:strand:+ start:12038 stop:12421 length:384 start_codon:yes stop_codon:yes gene_type:complete
MVTDPIADFIIQLKNASAVGHKSVVLPYSKLKHEIGSKLESQGLVGSVTKKGKKIKKNLEVELLYADGSPKISAVTRVSKPGRRVYKGSKDIRTGFNTTILSTPKGILTGEEAKKENVGGEILFTIK